MTLKTIQAGVLEVAYRELGPADGQPVILLHGFPYDIHCFDEVGDLLAARGLRCLIPYLRGYGPTRFLSADTPRSGQQAALAADLLAFMDALSIDRALLGGFDWGGRAACIVAALWPERVTGLVSGGHPYNIHDIPHARQPAAPDQEARLWYQYYFHTERGCLGLEQNRKDLACYLWRLWSPSWDFDADTFAKSAAAFDNPDFVAVVIHSYRHRYASVAGDPAYDAIEKRLEAQPLITVPTRVLLGADDGVFPTDLEDHYRHLYGPDYQRSLLPGVGHNAPQEAPQAFAAALIELADTSA